MSMPEGNPMCAGILPFDQFRTPGSKGPMRDPSTERLLRCETLGWWPAPAIGDNDGRGRISRE